jgi:hypothetical protein
MSQLSKKENVWSAAIGVLIGSMAGLMISLSMVKEYKKCEMLKRENKLLREMVMYYQDPTRGLNYVEGCGE